MSEDDHRLGYGKHDRFAGLRVFLIYVGAIAVAVLLMMLRAEGGGSLGAFFRWLTHR